MKNQFNAKVLLTVLSTLALVTSCGKSGNKVNTYSGVSAFNSSNSAFNTGTGNTIVGQYQSIKNSLPCTNGNRLTKDINFYASSGQFTGSKLLVTNWMTGFANSGTVNKMWVGVSAYRDLMFVTQMVDASNRVVGFNVSISMCEIKNSYTGTAFISDLTNFYNFATPYGIVLDSDTYCGYSMVDAAINTGLRYQNTSNSYYSSGNNVITTTFTKFKCNGAY